MISRKRSVRKPGTGLYVDSRKKRKSEMGRAPVMTKVGESRRKTQRVLGGNIKRKILQTDKINLYDGSKFVVATLKSVSDNSANRNFIRQNILTKGAVVDTDKGKAKITSRPGQVGTLNAVLVKEEK
ncbi:30S ribosomal protein S8e [Candidatus Woesearchaeota archaeon]|nr:30S ribosomal protein S8e [Candidatus Woesearchaeota archaeon]